MIITVSGLAGTGTTSVCEMLKEKTGYKYIYAGAIFREEAKKIDMPIDEFCHLLEEKPDLDRAIDEKVVEFAMKHDNTILEGRLAGWMIERTGYKSLKVLLTVPLDISAKRVSWRDASTVEEAMKMVKSRDERDKERYKKLYDINLDDESIYDLVIDTSDMSVEEEVKMILNDLNK